MPTTDRLVTARYFFHACEEKSPPSVLQAEEPEERERASAGMREQEMSDEHLEEPGGLPLQRQHQAPILGVYWSR